jgi:hypothetical protein
MIERVDRGPLKLPKGRRWAVYIISFATWLTGVLWLIYHYFMATQGRFGPVTHPLEPVWIRLHAAFSYGAVAVLGLLWGIHIVRGWNAKWRRWSGGVVVGLFVVLIVTGYGIYYPPGEELDPWISKAHWILGLATIVAFFVHWLSKSRPKS